MARYCCWSARQSLLKPGLCHFDAAAVLSPLPSLTSRGGLASQVGQNLVLDPLLVVWDVGIELRVIPAYVKTQMLSLV